MINYSVYMLFIYFVTSEPTLTKEPILEIEEVKSSIIKEWILAQEPTLKRKKLVKPILKNKDTPYQTKYWSNCRLIYARRRNGMNLGIINKKVAGMKKDNDINGLFEIQSYATSIVMLRHFATENYIAINEKGEIIVTPSKNDECLFYHYMEENGYVTFASVKYYINEHYDLFLNLKANGKVRDVRRTAPGQTSSQFILIPSDTNKSCIR
ncbi:fibroblast growth factor 1 [Hydra vulgaris]|nr:fibroblast growth factor 1 [Hydra vulgaris]